MMKKMIYFRLFILSLLGALMLSMISLYCLVKISDLVVEEYRYGYLLYIARSIEKSASYRPVEKVNVSGYPAPVAPANPFSLIEATEFGPEENKEHLPTREGPAPQRSSKPSLWLVSESGEILSSNSNNQLPISWEKLPHPKKVHGIQSNDNLIFEPRTFIVRLDTTPKTYLISHNNRTLFSGPFLWVQGIHTFATVALAVFLALSLSFYYLRRKSLSARKVLAKLEAGDLKARFEVKRFDEFGSLILDFNRMADEIERLVKRINDTESSRSNLLQELGHDVRTPLTSLNTSIETLQAYSDQLTEIERTDIHQMMAADIRYFRDLLDKLTIIATIEVPRYKNTTEKVSLSELIANEIDNRKTSQSHLRWNFEELGKSSTIMGDYHLLTRLFKNAFDNCSRYAQSEVNVTLVQDNNQIEIQVSDDGPGLSLDAIEAFGKRRERREIKDRDAANFSLGLGSVIMKAIAEVHDGIVAIENSGPHKTLHGACLRVTFKT